MNTNRFYLIDKSSGLTSFDVLRKLRKVLNIKKMGHTGTLDPLATGALLVATGNYTKLIPYFEKDRKEYICTIALDGVTPSFDKETEISYISKEDQENYKKSLTKESIQKVLEEKFTGEVEQVPPKYSALKIDGKKALDKIRLGEDFEMKKRKAIIYEIEILDYNYPLLSLRVSVSAGTYIRSIASDLGEFLGTGGYITELRRTKIGKLYLDLAQNLDDFNMEQILQEEDLFGKERFITLDDNTIRRMNDGLETGGVLDLENDKEYFVKGAEHITNVVYYKDALLKAKRRIL